MDEKVDNDKELSIYDDIGDYKPSRNREGKSSKSSHNDYDKSDRNYFNENPKDREEKMEGEITCNILYSLF